MENRDLRQAVKELQLKNQELTKMVQDLRAEGAYKAMGTGPYSSPGAPRGQLPTGHVEDLWSKQHGLPANGFSPAKPMLKKDLKKSQLELGHSSEEIPFGSFEG